MIRKIIALCLVLTLVSTVFTGCGKKETEPVKPDGDDVKEVVDDAVGEAKDAVDEHAGHDHD